MKHFPNVLGLLTALLLPVSAQSQWTTAPSGTTAELRTVEVVNPDTAFVGGANVFLRSTDGGQTWASLPILNSNNQPINGMVFNDLHFFNSQVGVAVGVRGGLVHTILRTTNGGVNWTTVVSANDPQGWDGGIVQVDFKGTQQGWCIGSSGQVRKTTDGGVTWTSLPTVPDLAYLRSVSFANSQVGYLAGEFSFGGGQLLKTTNGGQTWTVLQLSAAYQRLLAVHPDTVFLSQSDFAFRMTDGNLNFDFLPLADGVPVRQFAFQNGQIGRILTDNSTRRTADGGQFWEKNAFPGLNGGTMLDFDWANNFTFGIAVGSNGRILRTTNGGGTPTPLAYFDQTPNQTYVCKDQVIQCNNPAPASAYSSTWVVDGQFYSNANDISISFSEYGSTHTVVLQLSNGVSNSTFSREFLVEQSLEFQFGTVEWVQGPDICQGGNASVQVLHPTVNQSYFFELNGEVIAQQLAYDTTPITFQTPYLQSSGTIRVFAGITSACGSVAYEAVLPFTVVPLANLNTPWTVTPTVCYGASAQVEISNSEPGIQYWLVYDNLTVVSDTLAGNGGTLSFLSDPLIGTGNYQIRALNAAGCGYPLNQFYPVAVDIFFLELDTAHFYGIVNEAIVVTNTTLNLAGSQWDFGPNADPVQTTEPNPIVTFDAAGLFPYTYNFQSQLACEGYRSGTFEVFDQAPAPPGNLCWDQYLPDLAWPASEGEYVMAVQTDPQGNYWVTGARLNWNSGSPTMDFFLKKYDVSGAFLWGKEVDAANAGFNYRSSYGLAITFDPEGNAYLSGSFGASGANILGAQFNTPSLFFATAPQGFLFKLTPDGEVIWHSQFQALNDYDYCVPTDVVYHNGELHLLLKSRAWQMLQPDGNIAINQEPGATAWYLALDPNGGFLRNQYFTEGAIGVLQGAWHPETGGFLLPLSTFRSPRLKVLPTGDVAVSGVFLGWSTLGFGGDTLQPLHDGFLANNHFLAVLDGTTVAWKSKKCIFATGAESLERFLPAWEADADGNLYFGFGMSTTGVSQPPAVAIGNDFQTNHTYQSFLTKFTSDGNLLWWTRQTEQAFKSLLRADGGGVWALSRFNTAVGFKTLDGDRQGTVSNGQNDLLLSRIGADGTLEGLQALGGNDNEVPTALVSPQPGLLGMVSADGLNAFLNFPAQPYILRTWAVGAECPPVGTEEALSGVKVQVAPNPFTDHLRVNLTLKEGLEQVQLQLLNAQGQVVDERKVGDLAAGEQTLEWPLVPLPAGVYWLRVVSLGGVWVGSLVRG